MDEGDGPAPEVRVRIGALLRDERELAEMSAEDVAARLNLRTSFVRAIEEGRGDEHMPWSYERIHQRAIAALLGVELGSDI